MTSKEMDTSGAWRGASVLSPRSLAQISNNDAAPRPLTRAGPPARDAIYREVMKSMRAKGYFIQDESDSDSRSVDMNDMPDFDGVDNDDHHHHMQEDEDDAAAAAAAAAQALPYSVADSLFFSLPREIREKIYALCLHARDSLPVEWPRPEAQRRHSPYHIQSQILQTCRIVHAEAAPLLYVLNNLTFHHPSDSNVFVRALCDTALGRRITGLSLHIKAGDIRMWMAYLTSTDPHRSLRCDFPNLRELGLRYRSSRWNSRATPEENLQSWIDDSRLDELIDGVRGVYRPYWCTPLEEKLRAKEEQELRGFDPDNNIPEPEFSTAEESVRARDQYFELRHARVERARQKDNAPLIRICCACRVQPAHFHALTDPGVALHARTQIPRPAPVMAGILPDAPYHLPAEPLVEYSPFPANGFAPIDLQRDVKKLYDPELGSANVSRTPYVFRKGVLLALEIHTVDSRKDHL